MALTPSSYWELLPLEPEWVEQIAETGLSHQPHLIFQCDETKLPKTSTLLSA